MLVVSFYTPDYAPVARRLTESVDRFGYDRWIECVKDEGKWAHNCAKKARFIQRALLASDQAVLWLDADAEILRPLDEMVEIETQFAIHQKPDDGPKLRFSSGTAFFRPSVAVHRLLQMWSWRCDDTPDVWDQQHLYDAWEALRGDHRPDTQFLPITYCQRFDERHGVDDPHVVHYQESRSRRRREQAKRCPT